MNHVMGRGAPDQGAIEAILGARHGDPFAVLGPHDVEGGCAVRAFLPDATAVEVIARDDDQVLATLERIDAAGFWSGIMSARLPYRLRITFGDLSWTTEDPYSFGPLSRRDGYLSPCGKAATNKWVARSARIS